MFKNNLAKNKEDIDFLQSEEWRKFQELTGKRTFHVERDDFSVNLIEHSLPMVGRYFYIPRSPIVSRQKPINNSQFICELVDLAKKEKAGWIRFDAENEEILEIIRNVAKINVNKLKIVKAPHDMQPREVFVIDILNSEEELLADMKPKTRYNINLARKKGVKIVTSDKKQERNKKYIEEFFKLVDLTASRKGIKFHPRDYYRRMIESLPSDTLLVYAAEYNNKVIAANLIIFYGKTAIYLHGATDDEYRNAMAPYLLQWQAILDAKKAGCEKYDFGGVKTGENSDSWSGITKFKLGFSPKVETKKFPGSYDVVINRAKYNFYVIISKLRRQKKGG